MNIFETEKSVNDMLHKKESLYMLGVAGCAKSSIVRRLSDLGYNSVTMLTPKNALKSDHERKFKDIDCKLSVCTYASAFESVRRNKLDYDADIKQSTVQSDIFVLDEIFAVEPHLVNAAVKHAKNLNVPIIMLGDERQTTRHERIPRNVLIGGLKGFEYNESLRGDNINRSFIEQMYTCVDFGGDIETYKLAELMQAYGANVYEGLPTDMGNRIGFTRNAVSDTLLDKNGVCGGKLIGGKIGYTSTGDLQKKYRDCVCVSQGVKEMIQAVSGISMPVATPDNHWSHITCIGCEIDEGTDYNIVFRLGDRIDLSSAYTLLSRQKRLSDISIYLCSDSDLNPTLFKSYKSVKTFNDDYEEISLHVVKNNFYVRSTKSQLGIDDNISNTVITVSRKEFLRLLELTNEEFFESVYCIYCDDGVSIRPDNEGGKLVDEMKKIKVDRFLMENTEDSYTPVDKSIFEVPNQIKGCVFNVNIEEFKRLLDLSQSKDIDRFKSLRCIICTDDVHIKLLSDAGTLKESIDMYLNRTASDMTVQVMSEILQKAPKLVCDPTLFSFYKDTYLSLNHTSSAKIQQDKSVILEEKSISDDDLISHVPHDFLEFKKDFKSDSIEYILDLKSASWQILAEYPKFIGYGHLVPYNSDFKLHYYLCSKDDNQFILNTAILDVYDALGVNIERVVPLGSRKQTFDEVMTDEIRSHIHYSRQVRFDKSRMNKWGTFTKPRFTEERYHTGGKAIDVVKDNGKSSSLFACMTDIESAQNLILYLIAKAQTSDVIISTDNILCNDELIIPDELYTGVKIADFTLTAKKDGEVINEKCNADSIISGLEYYLAGILQDKKPSYKTKTTEAIKRTIQDLKSKQISK